MTSIAARRELGSAELLRDDVIRRRELHAAAAEVCAGALASSLQAVADLLPFMRDSA